MKLIFPHYLWKNKSYNSIRYQFKRLHLEELNKLAPTLQIKSLSRAVLSNEVVLWCPRRVPRGLISIASSVIFSSCVIKYQY